MALGRRQEGGSANRSRGRGGGEAGWARLLRSPHALKQSAVLAAFFAAAMLIIQVPQRPLPVHKGETAEYPILARVDFDYLDQPATDGARDLAACRTSGVYRPTAQPIVTLKEDLLALVDAVRGAATLDDVPEAVRTSWNLDADTFEVVKKSPGQDGANLPAVQQAIASAAEALAQPLNLPILSEADHQRESDRGKDSRDLYAKLPAGLLPPDLKPLLGHELTIAVVLAEGERELALQSVLTQAQVGTGIIRDRIAPLIEQPLGQVFGSKAVRRLASAMVAKVGPTLAYQAAETENRRAEARRRVGPVLVHWNKGTTLVKAGAEIEEESLRLLKQEAQAYEAQLGWLRKALAWAGVAAAIALLVVVQASAAVRLEASVGRSTGRSLVLAVLCLAVLGASKAVAQANWPVAFFCTFFLTTAGLVVAVAYDAAFALALVWGLAMLVALATQGDFGWLLVAWVGTAAAVLGLGRINNRSKLIKVGLLAGAVFFVAANGLALARLEFTSATAWPILRGSLAYLASGVAAGFVMLGLLPFIERAFGIVTNISLLELCDVNQPALKRLAIEAPGTYAHSLLLGTLAEAAAEAIGAAGLLARVGAYFHDIGKINKPRYFIENLQGGEQPHDSLSPSMSRLVITSHVRDGLEMADRLGLPPPIRRFIAEHHGTTLIEYFYREAERRYAAEGGEPPVEQDYRYPGPKPRSRETAIVMLADAVEGVARSLKDPTAPKIGAAVHEMVMKRLLDGQLDESGLSLSDLHVIEETLTKALASVYHGRVPYPAEREEEAAAEGAPVGRRGGSAGNGPPGAGMDSADGRRRDAGTGEDPHSRS